MPPAVDTDVLPVLLNGRSYQVEWNMYGHSLLQAQRPTVDQGAAPGEQSINPEGSWPRSQTDWSFGGMQETLDDEDGNPRRFYREANMQAVRRGRIQLSNKLQQMSTTRGFGWFTTSFPWTERLVVQTGNSVFWWELSGGNYTLYRQSITAGPYGGAIAPATAIAATATAMLILATDGVNTTWLSRGGSGVSRATTETGAFTAAWSAIATNVIIYANGHLLGVAGPNLWEFDTAGVKVGGADIFDHPNVSWTWQGGVAGAGRIYLWGSAGNDAAIYVLYDVLSSTGTLAPPKIACPLPAGEFVEHIEAVAGVFLVRTNLGLRLAVPNGDELQLGGLIIHRDLATDFPNIPICASASGGDVLVAWRNPLAQPDYISRVDLSRFVSDLVPAVHPIEYLPPDGTPANNGIGALKVVNRYDTQFQSGQLWVWGGKTDLTVRRVWACTINGAPNSDGTAREKVVQGTLDTGWITFNASDPKQPVSLRVIHDTIPTGAFVDVHVLTQAGAAIQIASCAAGTTSTDATINPLAVGPGRQFRLRFTVNRATDPTLTPSIASWTFRAYIQPARQEEIILPIMLKRTVTARGRGPRLSQDVRLEWEILMALAQSGAPVTLQIGGETRTVRVDDVQLPPGSHYRDYEARKLSTPSSAGTGGRFVEGVYMVRCLTVV